MGRSLETAGGLVPRTGDEGRKHGGRRGAGGSEQERRRNIAQFCDDGEPYPSIVEST